MSYVKNIRFCCHIAVLTDGISGRLQHALAMSYFAIGKEKTTTITIYFVSMIVLPSLFPAHH